MSFLFCSWATEENEENSETEEETTTKKDIASSDSKQISEDSKELKNGEINGELVSKKKEDVKEPSMFILWKDSSADYESEDGEETELENTESTTTEPTKDEEEKAPVTTNGIKENGDVEKKEEDSVREREDDPPVKAPMFFAVWKDPNKEDEYVSESSSEELSDNNPDEDEEDSPVVKEDLNEVPGKDVEAPKSNLFDSLIGETNGTDDLFNSIAKSVSNQMTTIFCDDDDFDIKRYDNSDNENVAEDYNDAADDDIQLVSVSFANGRRSRSASSHSVARSMQSSSSERSLRPKQEKNYDIFSKPKKISKYFQPGTFIDKTLYNTHRCDVKIKKFKLDIKDLEALAPSRHKRKVVEAEEDLPLSKRRKMMKAGVKKEPKPRSLNSITKREERADVEACYNGVCKLVKAQCPLCWNFWNLSQPYGQHVINQTCQQTDMSYPVGDVEMRMREGAGGNMKFIRVHPATSSSDSFVSSSRVPSLKLLSRGSLPGGNSTSHVGVMSVKEGLEYYHSLVQQGNTDETNLFRYISGLGKITLVSSVKQYERLCRDPLKVAIYLEKKISRSRARLNSRHLLTRNWVEKYEFFLKLPLHDIFLSLSVPGFRVLEVPEKESVRQICLVCSSMQCPGCSAEEKSQHDNKRKEPARSQVKKTKSKAKNKKKTRKDPPSRGSKSSGIKLQLHVCKWCKKYFKTVPALKSHMKYCR